MRRADRREAGGAADTGTDETLSESHTLALSPDHSPLCILSSPPFPARPIGGHNGRQQGKEGRTEGARKQESGKGNPLALSSVILKSRRF